MEFECFLSKYVRIYKKSYSSQFEARWRCVLDILNKKTLQRPKQKLQPFKYNIYARDTQSTEDIIRA